MMRTTIPKKALQQLVDAAAKKAVKEYISRRSDPDSELLTTRQAAELLQVKDSWFHQRHHYGKLPFPYTKVGQQLRFKRRDLEVYLKSNRSTR